MLELMDVGDEMRWRQLSDIGDGFVHSLLPERFSPLWSITSSIKDGLSFNISVGHQHL